MIQANELMIGSWVRHKPVWSYRQEGQEYKEFDFQWTETDWYAEGDCRISFDDIEPIPITEEWLLKLGFEKDGYNVDKTFYFEKDVIRINNYEGYFLDNPNEIVGKRLFIKYVHQLQNLYFALTQNELELQ